MISFILLYLVPLLVTFGTVKSQVSGDFQKVEYVGCFSTQYAQDRDTGHTFYPFSWESCILLCQSKGSRYAGLVHRRRKCYCGSYLVENSKASQPRECSYSCQGVGRKSCGGEKSMTVYQLKDDDSTRVLVTTRTMISYIKDSQLVPIITVNSGDIYLYIRIHYKNNEIYFNLNSDIVKSQYSTITNAYNPPSTVVSSGVNLGFAVDWVSDKMYFVRSGNIWEGNLNGTDQKQLLSFSGNNVYLMVIDPFEKQLYYNYQTTLRQYNIISNLDSTLLQSPSVNIFPTDFDVHSQAIYGVYSRHSIRIKLPNNNGFATVLETNVWGSIYNVLVADGNSLLYTIQSGSSILVHIKNTLERITITVPENRYSSVAVIHEVTQAPPKKVACLRMRCSHNCQYSPESFARCVCPSDMQLDSTGRRCKPVRSRRYSTEETYSVDYSSSYDRRRRHSDDDSSGSYESDERTSEEYSESKTDDNSYYESEDEETYDYTESEEWLKRKKKRQ